MLIDKTPITKESFEEFKQRLHDLRRGKHVDEHCTSCAIVLVKQKKRLYGFDSDYSDNVVISCSQDDFCTWDTPDLWFASLDDEVQQEINDKLVEDEKGQFSELSDHEKWEVAGDTESYDLVYWHETTEIINVHLTLESAQAFIERQKHNYPNAYTYVDSQWRVSEYNVIIDAILDGKIGFINPEEKP